MATLDLASITPRQLRRLFPVELLALHRQTHEAYTDAVSNGRAVEAIVTAHDWIAAEMTRRGMKHQTPIEAGQPQYPAPNFKERDLVLVPDYVSVVGSATRLGLDEAHDLDVLIRDDVDQPKYWRENLYLLVRRMLDPNKTGKDLHLLFNPQGPHDGPYMPLFDLVLRVSDGEVELIKASGGLRFTLMGTTQHPGLLVECGGRRVMLDNGAPTGDIDAWLVTDPQHIGMREIRDTAEGHNAAPVVSFFYSGDVSIEPRAVRHKAHETYAYVVTAANRKVVWAPRFLEFPGIADGADLMFAGAMAWNRTTRFADGGHMALLTIAEFAKRHEVKRLVFVGAGRTVLAALKAGERIPFGEVAHDGDTFQMRSAALARLARPEEPPEAPFTKITLKPYTRYQAQKPTMLGYTDFKDVTELWKDWGEKKVTEQGSLLVSPKVDGLRAMFHGAPGKDPLIYLEDAQEDRSKQVPDLVDQLKNADTTYIVEGELCAKAGGKFLARPDVLSALAGNVKADFYVFMYDVLYFNDVDVHTEPFVDRLEYLKAWKRAVGGSRFIVLPQVSVKTEAELFAATKKALAFPGPAVEGIVTRTLSMPYTFGATDDYAKSKIYVELKVVVIKPIPVTNGWVYECGLSVPLDSPLAGLMELDGDGVFPLGKTFVSKEKLAEIGDTLNVGIEELLLYPDGTAAWGKPTPLGPDKSRGPYTLTQAISLCRRFGVLKEMLKKDDDDNEPDEARMSVAGGSKPVLPYGPNDAALAIVGDGPGRIERQEGRPLVGPSGIFLRKVLTGMGVDPEQVWWANVYDGSGEGTLEERGTLMLRQLDKLPHLKAVLAISAIAAGALTGEILPSIDEWRGKDYKTPGGTPIVVTYHPSALLRSGQKQSQFYGKFHGDVADAVKLAGISKLSPVHAAASNDDETNGETYWRAGWFDALPSDGSGRYVYQHHWRGLGADEAKLLEADLLNTDHSLHGDARFEGDDALFGFTVFLGKVTDNKGLPNHDRLIDWNPDDNLQGTWKLAQPKGWLDVGVGKPYSSAPAEVGATSQKWARFFAQTTGHYRLGCAREHMLELFMQDGKLKGRLVIMFAPMGGGQRVWLVDRPTGTVPYAAAHKLADVIKELRGKDQKYLVWGDETHGPYFITLADHGDDLLAALDIKDVDQWAVLDDMVGKGRRTTKAAGMKLTLLGVGAEDSPKYKPAGLLVECGDVRVMFDGGKNSIGKSEPDGALDAWLWTDSGDEQTATRRAMAKAHGTVGRNSSFRKGGLAITMEPTKHTGHKTFGYVIDDGKTQVVWAPEFFEFPAWAKDAYIMFADAASWGQPIHFAGGVGGHMNVLQVSQKAKAAGVERLIFAHIGRPTIDALKAGEKVDFGEFGSDGQTLSNKAEDQPKLLAWTDVDAKIDGEFFTKFVKATDEKRYTFGILYKATDDQLKDPEFDAHNEAVTADTLQNSQWNYVRSNDRNIYLQHGLVTGSMTTIGEWVDIVSWPFETKIDMDLPTGEHVTHVIPANSVFMGVVWNDLGWRLVKEGKIRGYSMGGWARRKAFPV
jgi:uracil-DNA glycosylase family 4